VAFVPSWWKAAQCPPIKPSMRPDLTAYAPELSVIACALAPASEPLCATGVAIVSSAAGAGRQPSQFHLLLDP
jgi:hypothetical protein